MIQEELHNKLVARCSDVISWFEERSSGLQFPFYSSFDVRDSGRKVGPVDANIFPAGFNNICQQDKDAAVEVVSSYLDQHYSVIGKNIGLVTEEHTKNAYYWENVLAIKDLLENSGRKVTVALPRKMDPIKLKSSSGREVEVFGSDFGGASPSLLISNNDFSEAHEDWANNISIPMNPPRQLGWYKRRKSNFFSEYNTLAGSFAELLDMDPFCLQVTTEAFDNFDVSDESNRDQLAERVQSFIDELGKKYQQLGLDQKPFAFVKNNAGTYGMAVVRVESGEDVKTWNNRARTKMKAAKGGQGVSSLIIQEGIPTRFQEGDATAEPCIYVLGSHLIGGFLRTHSKKSGEDNLNSPGAVFKKLCMSDMEIDLSGCPMEAVYGWVSRLGVLAVAQEAKAAGIEFQAYH